MPRNLHEIRYTNLADPSQTPLPLRLTVESKIRVVIFSDSHFDLQFDPERLQKFEEVISRADLVIINGDFWLDKHTTFEEFLASPWSPLFPLLKSKHAIYLFGNHDMPQFSDPRIDRFCDQVGFSLELTVGTQVFYVEHGHLLADSLTLIVLKAFESHPRLLGALTAPIGVLNELVLKSKNLKLQRFAKRINIPYKFHPKYANRGDSYLVMGHTHVAERDDEHRYINLGRTHNGDFSYLRIAEGAFELVTL